jgi:signal recognition particle receptor subunit beta
VSSVNVLAREVAAKIVFYGPGLSGKTTTLRKVYESVRPAHRGEMMSLATEGDRTLFFDFLPVKVERVGDCSVRLALYTVPGQVFYNATRKLVLQGADGVVFVADSQPQMLDSNVESLRNLEENLAEQGIRLERFPLVLQWNKRDLPEVLPVQELRTALNPRNIADFETCATSGRGILDTLKTITRLVIKDLRSKRVVPPPREPIDVTVAGAPRPNLEQQLQQHLRHADPNRPPPKSDVDAVRGRPGPPAIAGRLPMGPASALSPGPLLDYAKAADMSFISGDHAGCVSSCVEAVRRALAYAGEGSLSAQAYLLGVDGTDLLKLHGIASKSPVRVDDAAFALYVLMQVFTRLATAGLPTTE